MNEQMYRVKGMHCLACEILIEKKLLELPGVRAVDASVSRGEVVIEYDNQKPSIESLNALFQKDNYSFAEAEIVETKNAGLPDGFWQFFLGFAVALAIVIIFLLLDRFGVSGFLNITTKSSLVSFFIFGVLASLSSCAALVGGMILSLSKQWNELYGAQDTVLKKIQPHFLFNAGRVASYALLGGVLGFIGYRLAFSFTVTAWLVIVVSLVMIMLGLQMLGFQGAERFQLRLPKFITRFIVDEKRFQGKYMPFVFGALTFFLPCGFTITAQTIALLSASAVQGALIMGFFALGTTPVLLLIGSASVAFFSRPHMALLFSKVAGFLVLFFACYNIWNQINLLV
jgi:sulfite exporter TauE/SafE/copper chaperone CopZ